MCFSNEFSTFSHKIVYMDFQVGSEVPLTPNIEEHATALTALESAAQEIHKSLNSILDYQTHHRLVRTGSLTIFKIGTDNAITNFSLLYFCFFNFLQREAQGRKRAEDLNERVLWWSIAETFAILAISVTQILVLRNFFTDRSPSQQRYSRL